MSASRPECAPTTLGEAGLVPRRRPPGGVERGADDAGVVAQRRRHDLGLDVEQRQELVGVLADPAADDEQVGGEQLSRSGSSACSRSAHSSHDRSSRSRTLLAARDSASWPSISRWPSSEFGTSTPSWTSARADAGAERGDDDQPALAACRAVPHLGEPGGVGVVDHVTVAAGASVNSCVGVGADPALVDVGGRAHDAVPDDARDGHPDRRRRVGEPADAARRPRRPPPRGSPASGSRSAAARRRTRRARGPPARP